MSRVLRLVPFDQTGTAFAFKKHGFPQTTRIAGIFLRAKAKSNFSCVIFIWGSGVVNALLGPCFRGARHANEEESS